MQRMINYANCVECNTIVNMYNTWALENNSPIIAQLLITAKRLLAVI